MNTPPKNLIYFCCCFQKDYVGLLELLLKSLAIFGELDRDETDLLVITDKEFEPLIQRIYDALSIEGKIFCQTSSTMLEAAYARLSIFDYPDIGKYQKLLYLDCDILITNKIGLLTQLEIENKLYTLEEGNTDHPFFGETLFEKSCNPNTPAFTTGIMLFNNCEEVKRLFTEILCHIEQHLKEDKPVTAVLEQSFVVYHAVTNQLYNNTRLIGKIVNNPVKYTGESISHFAGSPGHYGSKSKKMTRYFNYMVLNYSDLNQVDSLLYNDELTVCNRIFASAKRMWLKTFRAAR